MHRIIKKTLKTVFLRESGHQVQDLGAYTLDPADDYPDFAQAVATPIPSTPTSAAATGDKRGFSCNLSPESGGIPLGGAGDLALLGLLMAGIYAWGRRTRR